jgi:peptidoglycan/xylan/chitin deacetylase (PgdA/CDA1 family)
MSRVAILGYHKVGPPPRSGWGTWYYVSEELFVGHLEALARGGWVPVDAAAFVRGLIDAAALPERTALITFDDGYASLFDGAVPHLERFGYPAVLFAPTDFVGRTNAFDRDSEPKERICNWDELRELERHGVSVQSHGASHRAFSELRAGERTLELERSKAALEDKLERPVELFAYPYGDDAAAAPDVREALVRAGYLAAFGYGGGVVPLPPRDRYRVQRLALGADSDLAAMLDGA